MLYELYQAQADLLLPLRHFARVSARVTRLTGQCFYTPALIRHVAAGLTMFADASLTHARPPFGIDTVVVDGRAVAVTEEAADETAASSSASASSRAPGSGVGSTFSAW